MAGKPEHRWSAVTKRWKDVGIKQAKPPDTYLLELGGIKQNSNIFGWNVY